MTDPVGKSSSPQSDCSHSAQTRHEAPAEDFLCSKEAQTGQALLDAMQASPYRGADLEPPRERSPVRDVEL
jgi:hypothetical protein